MSQTHTLMTFNIPTHLKTNFDELSKFKRVSKTSIINHLIEWYCRNERKELEGDDKLNHLIRDMKLRNHHVVKTEKVRKEPTFGQWSTVKKPDNSFDDWDEPVTPPRIENVNGDTDWNDPTGVNFLWDK